MAAMSGGGTPPALGEQLPEWERTSLERSSSVTTSCSGDRSPDRPPADAAAAATLSTSSGALRGGGDGGIVREAERKADTAFDPRAAWAVADHACKSAESALKVPALAVPPLQQDSVPARPTDATAVQTQKRRHDADLLTCDRGSRRRETSRLNRQW